ncbi:phage tail assembly chaperone [Gammaproteobacteria bacterium]|nr:phage tail assembly chaperone [Gammaproteobacteria bacterium]
MYVKINNGVIEHYPYTLERLRSDNPNVSFPKEPSDELLSEWGVFPVGYQSQPEYNSSTQRVDHSAEPELVEGNWVLTNEVVSLTSEQQAAVDERAAILVRKRRDALLKETDWYGLSDITMPAEMATYRQALRDITTHANFPNLTETDWPTKPE